MKKVVWVFLIFSLGVITILYGTSLRQYEPHRIFEFLGVSKNRLKISLDESGNQECSDLKIFWRGEKESLTKNDRIFKHYYDTLLIYDRGKPLRSIPDRYGKSGLIIEYCGMTIEEPGLYKHDYILKILVSDTLIVEWEISNLYESYSGEVSNPLSF